MLANGWKERETAISLGIKPPCTNGIEKPGWWCIRVFLVLNRFHNYFVAYADNKLLWGLMSIGYLKARSRTPLRLL